MDLLASSPNCSAGSNHVYVETNQFLLTNDTHNIVHPGKQRRSHRTKLYETSLQDGDDERNDPYYSQVSAAGDHHEKGLKYHSNHIFWFQSKA